MMLSCVSRNVRTDFDYHVCAFIWPSCHDDSLGRAVLWEEGNGEWEIIQKGDPRFEGHYQPKLPLWGYEHDDDPMVVEKWINTALEYGVNTFIYDWYSFLIASNIRDNESSQPDICSLSAERVNRYRNLVSSISLNKSCLFIQFLPFLV